MLLADGFEKAIIGWGKRPGDPDPVVIYDFQKCVNVLMKRDGMDYEGAVEFIEFNTEGAWVGPGTPILMHRANHAAILEMAEQDEA